VTWENVMADYLSLCKVEMSKAESDKNHVGGVCRINKNDELLITFHNNNYETPASPPLLGDTQLALSPAPRIPPLKNSIKKEMKIIHQHPAKRDYQYSEELYNAASNNQTNLELEALTLHRERLKYGLDDYERCRAIAKEQQLERLKQNELLAKKRMEDTYDTENHRKLISKKTMEAYRAIQGRSLDYPSEYTAPQLPNLLG
jgi:hypothetical protein